MSRTTRSPFCPLFAIAEACPTVEAFTVPTRDVIRQTAANAATATATAAAGRGRITPTEGDDLTPEQMRAANLRQIRRLNKAFPVGTRAPGTFAKLAEARRILRAAGAF